MLKTCPRFLQGRLRFSFAIALRECHRAKLEGDMVGANRAWKLFGLVPILLLSRPAHIGSVGRDELAKRADEFAQGGWGDLLTKARENSHDFPAVVRRRRMTIRAEGPQLRPKWRGQVSRARHELTGAPLAPKNATTLEELQSKRLVEQASPIPQAVLDFVPESTNWTCSCS